jgi:tetratricopeptide (TPR) repeat protein
MCYHGTSNVHKILQLIGLGMFFPLYIQRPLRRFGVALLLVLVACASGVGFAATSDFDHGVAAAYSGDLELAVQHWSKMIRKNPKSYAAHVNRGHAYIRSGRVLAAILDWHKANELAPAFAYAAFTGDFIPSSSENRLLNFAAPLELDPNYLPSVCMTAVAYLDVGRPDKAIEIYRKSIELTANPLLKSYLDHWASSVESARME